ncbi:hypothetical protein QYE76_053850 [Lolium multiflorum]|uniref:Uncharacterized protein n=1 Tax=Lolium multiflorum TaxID=4521 RepID=A0AAD8SY34_LOLMU|nr:hypothetical protein QYE76_053850 [Lolium multiflorum]
MENYSLLMGAAVMKMAVEMAAGIQTAITILKGFASQFSSLQADKARLQEEVQSTSSKLDQAVTMAATARHNADSLKKELDQLKKKLKEREKEKAEAQSRRKEREDLLHNSTLALLEVDNIPASSVGKLPDGSSADAISLAIESTDLIRAFLQKNKAVMSRLHAMILQKEDQEKTLGQLTGTFFVNTKGTIEVFKRTSSTYDALLAF